ncbi:MAG: hypothetical protein ACLTXH_15435 [Enterobacter hormaechei]
MLITSSIPSKDAPFRLLQVNGDRWPEIAEWLGLFVPEADATGMFIHRGQLVPLSRQYQTSLEAAMKTKFGGKSLMMQSVEPERRDAVPSIQMPP